MSRREETARAAGRGRPALALGLLALALAACAGPTATPTVTPAPTVAAPNLDAETQALIARSRRVAFIVPFSHWDTDWHDTYANYVQRSDGNILAAIRLAQASPEYRYTLEQVLFVQHFWETHPEARADLTAAVRRRQITFAWAGLTQPETSLVAPAVQVRNLQLGQEWIASTFGPEYVPHTAWQSDAFGNSAAFPRFLTNFGVPYLFIGRWQNRCDPDFQDCTPLPHAFYWQSPLSDARVLAVYLSYPGAWDAIHRLTNEGDQVTALRKFIEDQFARTDSRYVFIPFGSDFIDPMPNLPSLVQRWNAENTDTALVMADPETAFKYLATQPLPEMTVDLNPIWQAFYATRPYAKVADKETDYLLTAADKFGLLLGAPESAAWQPAAVSAHYDNISGVGFDAVWNDSQRPRYEQTLATASADLSSTLLRLAAAAQEGGSVAPLVVFNPASWSRSEVIEIEAPGHLPDPASLPGTVQPLGSDSVAFLASDVPSVGFTAPAAAAAPAPATISQSGGLVTLSNGLVSVSLDPAHGGAFTSLSAAGGPELLSGYGDDVTFMADTGDVYGARFGDVAARESQGAAQVEVQAEGPLLARASFAFEMESQPITKTVTLRAGSPWVEVALQVAVPPDTSAVLQMQDTLATDMRTDDLGFAAFEHTIDTQPIHSGDITYRRRIFYPIVGWSDVTAGGSGLSLLTHGLQAPAGTDQFSLLLLRQAADPDGEGVTDPGPHTLRYAYLPHGGSAVEAQSWLAATAFNQPLIAAWRSGAEVCVQLPFGQATDAPPVGGQVVCQPEAEIEPPASGPFAMPYSLLSADSGLVADLHRDENGQVQALVLDYDPATPTTINAGGQPVQVTGPFPALIPLELP